MGFAARIIASCTVPVALAIIGVFVATYLSLSGIVSEQQEHRILFRLENLRASIEANLSLGFQLAQIGGTQDLLERAKLMDANLQALDVFSSDGVSVYSTDRGVKGEPVPPGWHAAAQRVAPEAHWRYETDGELVLGLPIRNDLGDVIGSIISITPPERDLNLDWSVSFAQFALWLVPIGLAVAAITALLLNRLVRRHYDIVAHALAGHSSATSEISLRVAKAHAARSAALTTIADLEKAIEQLEAVDHAL